jgi:membrane fusion protein, multidrug efflux system
MIYSRILAIVLIVAATLWIGSGVFGRTEAPADAHGAPAAAAPVEHALFQVAVTPVKVEEHSRVLSLSGRTEADNRASAIARTAGSIVELNVKRGDRVKEGDVIATLSDEAREAQVAQAQALVDQKRIDLEAKLKLIKRGVIAANEENALQAELRAAEAALAMAKAEHMRGLIIAPISGVVSGSPMTTGQAVDANMMVAEVIALDPMLAVAEVAERQLGAIKVGDEAGVRLVTGQTATGIVRYVAPTASTGTRTYRVEVEVDNSDLSIPDGVTAEVEFKLSPVPSARVPRSALTFSAAGELSVRVVGDDGIVSSVPVGVVEDAREEIWISGPKDGAKIIVQGQDFVKDGQKVGTVDAEGAPAPTVTSQS